MATVVFEVVEKNWELLGSSQHTEKTFRSVRPGKAAPSKGKWRLHFRKYLIY